jgi:hypothetical protein
MARRKTKVEILDSKRDLTREAAVEHAPVRLDGVGEHPAIQAAASPEFATMSNAEAFNVSLAIQELVRGQASILQNQAMLSDSIAKVNEKMKRYDEDAKKWEDDRVKFLEDVNRRADKLRVTDPAKRAEMATKVMEEERNAMAMAKAMVETNKIKFLDVIARAPKVKITSPGVIETGRIGDQPVTRIVPEVIRIKNFEWKLPPGIPFEVPDFVARRFEQRHRDLEELEERKLALSADRNNGKMTEASEVAQKMTHINQKYGTAPDYTGA